jgi:Uma2 family endonuclease
LDSNLKVGIPQLGKFVYPDVLAVCGPPQFDPRDKSRQSIINPRMIVEVLSPTTEAYDRGGKFSKYRMLEAFHEYVLVTQDCALIETFFRQPDGVWLFAPVAGIDGVVKLRSVGVELRLLDIYQGVDFPAAPEPSTDELALDQPG